MGHPEVPDGGWGDPSDRRDTTLAAKAVRERWPIGEKVRIKVLNRLCAIVDPETEYESAWDKPSIREVVSAARAILSADKLNLDQQRLDLQTKEEEMTVKQIVSEAEARAAEHVPDEPPAGATHGP